MDTKTSMHGITPITRYRGDTMHEGKVNDAKANAHQQEASEMTLLGADMLRNGVMALRVSSDMKFVPRLFIFTAQDKYLAWTKNLKQFHKSERAKKKLHQITLADVKGITIGPFSSAFKRVALNRAASYKKLESYCCMSIVTVHETLDIVVDTSNTLLLFILGLQTALPATEYKWTRGAVLAYTGFLKMKESVMDNWAYSLLQNPERTRKKLQRALVQRVISMASLKMNEGGRQTRSVFAGKRTTMAKDSRQALLQKMAAQAEANRIAEEGEEKEE